MTCQFSAPTIPVQRDGRAYLSWAQNLTALCAQPWRVATSGAPKGLPEILLRKQTASSLPGLVATVSGSEAHVPPSVPVANTAKLGATSLHARMQKQEGSYVDDQFY